MYKTKEHLGKFLCTTILALIPSMHTLAQAEGKVIDEHGEPIVGATVRWEGTSVGTTTDANGKFRLEKNGHLHEVVTSMMGYKNDTTCSHSAKYLVIRLQELVTEYYKVFYGYELSDAEYKEMTAEALK